MPQRTLKSILRKDKNVHSLLGELCQRWGASVRIEDIAGRLLWEYGNAPESQEFQITSHHHQIGAVFTQSENGDLIAALLSHYVAKELEKKKMGTEVLGLYREINMIYDFSEKISEKIDADSISKIALTEATQIIQASQGLFLLQQPYDPDPKIMASHGDLPEQEKLIQRHSTLLENWITKGISTIIPAHQIHDLQGLASIRTLMYAPLKVKHHNLGLLMLARDNEEEFTAAELKLLTTIALQSAAAIESARLYEKGLREAQEREEAIRKMHEASTRFVPYEFIRSLGKSKLSDINLGDSVERQVTVLFADIRDFTTFSETMSPEDNFQFVNAFNKRMGPIIRKHKGFINQYLGDGFMAIFPGGSDQALKASVEMHQCLENYNGHRVLKDRKPVQIGVGMHSGHLIMGITGDLERMDAAIISDTVNTASRIESLSKHYGTSILLTGDSKAGLTNTEAFDFRYLGLVQVKGKQHPLELYECINGDPKDLYQHKLATIETFDQAMTQFHQKEFAMAAVTFQEVVKGHPEDKTARLLLNRSATLITKEVGEDWQGIEMMQLK